MTWPLQPIGPRSPETVTPVDRARGTERRKERDEDAQHHKRQPEHDDPPTPDADGHIDVLA
jgi:hypothetical protein